MTEEKRDLYADGWLEGIRQARVIVYRADSLGEAAAVLEALIVQDYRSRKERTRQYLPTHGGRARKWERKDG